MLSRSPKTSGTPPLTLIVLVGPFGAGVMGSKVSLPLRPLSLTVVRSVTPTRLLRVKVSLPSMPLTVSVSAVPMSRAKGPVPPRAKPRRPAAPAETVKRSGRRRCGR